MNKMKFEFNHKGKKEKLDVEVCDNIFSKARGLMFKKKSKPLLFVFNRPTREAIHSFFCVKFIAIWFMNNKIVDVKIVNPWKISVRPKQKFNKLLEIPFNDYNFEKISRRYRKL
jgi:uncharacterized membrane protein (UPF0127 family)